MHFLQCLYILALIMFVVTDSFADTKNRVIFNCEWERNDPVTCTACNIYHESRGENAAGQLAVALVTKNRVKSSLYPGNYCDVVWEIRTDAKTKKRVPMFSWTLDGKSDRVYNEERWNVANLLARQVVNKRVHDITIGSLWYHSINVNPRWMNHYYPTVRIGDHQFYAAGEEDFVNTLLEQTLPSDLVAKVTITD